MSEPFLGQLMMAAFNFAPRGYAMCNGQLLPINQNQALFALLGTQFGGNGQTTFALPDMRGRTPVGFASSVDAGWQPTPMQLGERAGVETVQLSAMQAPLHSHRVGATTAAGSSRLPSGRVHATSVNTTSPVPLYAPGGPLVGMAPSSVTPTGAASVQAHPNMQPYATVNFCIALQGIFPSPN